MGWEHYLRRWSVGQRMAAIIALLLAPVGCLSVASIFMLERQEISFRETVEESVQTLLPLTSLEHYLQRALVDELEAQSDTSVPNFSALTSNIDQSFAAIQRPRQREDLPPGAIDDAQKAWRSARPAVQQLIEQVRSVHGNADPTREAMTRDQLQRAINDISLARQRLAGVVQQRYRQAIAERHRELRWLIASWAITLALAATVVLAFLRTLLQPVRQLARSARRLGAGERGVRVPIEGSDELSELAERFNAMAATWEAAHQQLRNEAQLDPLTGIYNRRGIFAELEDALSRHVAQGQPLALLMIDLNHFKAINDRFGHSAGDRALVWVASRLRGLLRPDDRLGRYGGDEFVVFLAGTTREQAEAIGQRMIEMVAQAAASEPKYPTLSIGLASAPEDGWDAAALVHAADLSLYQRRATQPGRAPTSLDRYRS